MKHIESVAPAEDSGRDTISRFDMQFQAAAFAALEILEGNGIDCVYCDFHDDFVVRRQINGQPTYHFFQVKTKKRLNHQWSTKEIFAIASRSQGVDEESLGKIKTSFAGKLLLHAIVFDNTCSEVTLLSNVHFDEGVVTVVDELRGRTPKAKAAKFLADNFSAIFSIEPPADPGTTACVLGKLSLRAAASYIETDRGAFASAARTAIHNYSEIDLSFDETTELANGLVDLVSRKSRTSLEGVAKSDIESLSGVGLDDLLEILCISRTAYEALLKGAVPKALKTASVITRWMKQAGADDAMIEFASHQKVKWDIWLRDARHIYSPMDMAVLLALVDKLHDDWVKPGATFSSLDKLICTLSADSEIKKFSALDRELLFGAVGSVVVRRYSK
ncbi:MAG: DUF4297 domain-containing protein [Betaproteobacteria bacterium HGW-Betaproteobacteria-11]|nr:MAG: DUF4297 domain-containing protein [Betaproteobacteria bacterium HGW-Betaproteobacteria-11]